MPSPLSLIARRLGRPAAERSAELSALTRRTGHEHGALDVLGSPGRIYTSGRSNELTVPDDEWAKFRRARHAGKPTWDVHTHPSDAPGDPVNAPSYQDVLEAMRMAAIRPGAPHHALVVGTPGGGDSAYGYRLGPTRLPWKTQTGMLDRLHLDVSRLTRDPRFLDQAYGTMADARFQNEGDATEWLSERLLDTLRPMRLAERDRLGGEVWHSMSSDTPAASPRVELDPMVDELYRIARKRGFGEGGAVQADVRKDEEARFMAWYKKNYASRGINPNPDDPRQRYDYRSAWMHGDDPDPVTWHGSSRWKLEGHPRLIVDGVNTKTGEPVRRASGGLASVASYRRTG